MLYDKSVQYFLILASLIPLNFHSDQVLLQSESSEEVCCCFCLFSIDAAAAKKCSPTILECSLTLSDETFSWELCTDSLWLVGFRVTRFIGSSSFCEVFMVIQLGGAGGSESCSLWSVLGCHPWALGPNLKHSFFG